jgi:hypothetical protein
MEKCCVPDCDYDSPLRSESWGTIAASFETYLPVLAHFADLQPDQATEYFHELLLAGIVLLERLHAAAHSRIDLFIDGVTPGVLQSWKSSAEEQCLLLAKLDPEWSSRYWSEVQGRGLDPWAMRYDHLVRPS